MAVTPRNVPARDSADEAALLERLRGGDDLAFEHIVRVYGSRLLAVTSRVLGDTEDAKDAVQDAFLAAFRGLDRFEGQARLSTWLHRIALNAALTKLRSRRRKPEESIDALLPTFVEDGHQVRPSVLWETSVDRTLDERRLQSLVRQAIDRLPEPYRTVLLLRDIDDLDTEETARVLGLNANTVKTRLHRARQALQALLDPHCRKAL